MDHEGNLLMCYRTEGIPTKHLRDYVHSANAVCVRNSEGSFAERQRRLDRRLRQSREISKADLVQRNIVQGINVVRRGIHTVEVALRHRPRLGEMIATKRLPPDYLDQLFPDSAHPRVAERPGPQLGTGPLRDPYQGGKAPVSLHQLLPPPPSSAQPGNYSSSQWQPSSSSYAAPEQVSSAGNGLHVQGGQNLHGQAQPWSMPPSPQVGSLDPAMLAAMMVQAAIMAGNRPPGGPAAMNPGSQMLGAGSQTAGLAAVPPQWRATGGPVLPPFFQPVSMAGAAASQGPEVYMTSPSSPAFIGSCGGLGGLSGLGPQSQSAAAGAPQRAPKPSLQAQRTATSPYALGSRVMTPPFVMLMEDFCDRMLGHSETVVSGSGY